MRWQVFALLYTLGATGYAIAAKLSGGRISPLLGALVMTASSLAIIVGFYVVYRIHGAHFTYNRYGVEAALFAGLAIAVADISLFFMYAKGAPLSVAGVLTELISIAAIVLIGLFLLKEPLTLSKAIGIVFSALGIVFLFRG